MANSKPIICRISVQELTDAEANKNLSLASLPAGENGMLFVIAAEPIFQWIHFATSSSVGAYQAASFL